MISLFPIKQGFLRFAIWMASWFDPSFLSGFIDADNLRNQFSKDVKNVKLFFSKLKLDPNRSYASL